MQFTYQTKNRDGNYSSGIVEAPSEQEAVRILQGKGLIILGLEKKSTAVFKKDLSSFLSKVKSKDIVTFTRQFATLVDADVPIVGGLRTLGEQTENPNFKKIIQQVADSVDAGSSLSASLAEHPKVFTSFYTSLIKSGETAGKLHDVMLYLADYLERSEGLKSKIKGALTYPIFILCALTGVGTFMMVSIIPQLLGILKESGVESLPFTTKILMVISGFLDKYLVMIIIILVVGVWFFRKYIKTPNGKKKFDTFLLKAPILGKIEKGIYLARICESLSTLIKADVQILESLKIASEVVSNSVYSKVLLDAQESVTGGGMISGVFAQHKDVFPPLVTQMVAIGEKTGKIDFMLGHLSNFYKEQSERTVQSLSTILEPVLMIIMGVAVGFLVSAVLLPMYSMVGA